jgi:hypothetical protein
MVDRTPLCAMNATRRDSLVRGNDAIHLASLQYRGTKAELSAIRDKAQRDIFTRLNLASNTERPAHGNTENPRHEKYAAGGVAYVDGGAVAFGGYGLRGD